MFAANEKAVEARARRAARRCGLRAMKSRRAFSGDNYGGFMLVNDDKNSIVAGERFNMSAEHVLEYCKDE